LLFAVRLVSLAAQTNADQRRDTSLLKVTSTKHRREKEYRRAVRRSPSLSKPKGEISWN
jgi:hypothetical protein